MNEPAFPYAVFPSHSAKDKAVVRPLAERLRRDGLRVSRRAAGLGSSAWLLLGSSHTRRPVAGANCSRVGDDYVTTRNCDAFNRKRCP
jgi:hypothetical protein